MLLNAARILDPVSHNDAAEGFLAGSVVAGAVTPAVYGGAVTAATAILGTEAAGTVLAVAGEAAMLAVGVTGGAALVPLAIGGLAIAAGVVAAGVAAWGLQKLGAALGSMVSSGTVGHIVTGSPNVTINGRNAAFVTSPVDCHDGEIVAMGAATVFINGKQAARVSSQTTMAGTVIKGSDNVLIGGPSVTIAPIKPWGLGIEILGDVLAIGPQGILGLGRLAMSLPRLAGEAFEGVGSAVRAAAESLAPSIGRGTAEAAGDAERAGASVAAEGTGTAAGGSAGESTATAEQVGHPVNPATGAVFTGQTDFVLPGPLPLVFARIWISSSTIAGELGFGWHHTLDMALRRLSDGRVAVRLRDGRYVVFEAPRPGAPSRNAVERLQLWTDGRQAWLTDHDGIRFGFGAGAGSLGLRRLTRIADANGNAIVLTRDDDGGLAGIIDSAGRRLGVRRDARGRIVGIDAPHPDGVGALTLAGFDYDEAGDLVASCDATGGTFRYGYERHRLVREERPAGLAFGFRYDAAGRCVSTWGDGGLYERHLTYDDAARATIVRSRRGAVERFEVNAMGRVTAHVDALGRRTTRAYAADMVLVSETRADGATRTARHDAFGRVVETTGFDGVRRLLHYAERPDGLAVRLPDAVTGPGGIERFGWDERFNLVRHVDAAGRERRFVRDVRGYTLAIADALGTARRFGWTERGELAWEAGNGAARTAYRYDGLGRMVESRRAGEAATRYLSDAAGRLIEIRRPDGGLIRLTHDAEGHVTSHRDGAGHVTRWVHDGLPYPVRRINADGSGLLYRYDEDLNLVGLSNAKGEPYSLAYDLADQLVGEIGFDGRRRTYDYDAAGFLVAHSDEEGRGASYRRDPAGRLLERRHADGLTDIYAYDASGALTRAANDWGEVGFGYGPGGVLVEERCGELAIRHRHDASGRRIASTLPDGRVVETAYDAAGGVVAVGFGGREVAAFRRDGLGRETARRSGAVVTVSEYDPQGRLARQTGRGRNPGPVVDRHYRWDEADRLVETIDLARGMRSYQYDACERLVGVAGDAPESFVVDPAGNILGDGGEGTGAAIGDRLLIRGDRKFDYDGCGNRVREVRGAGGGVERLYRYRADNQLGAVEEQSRRGCRLTSFRYDALGRRTEKRSTAWAPAPANDDTTPSGPVEDRTTRFVWSGNVLLAESTAEGDAPAADPLATIYLHEPGSFRPLAQVARTAPGEPGVVYHYHLDHLGTPREVTNDDGRVVWQASLKAWGAVARTMVAEVAQPVRFQGQYCDVETGLHYNRFRYYAPDEGCYVHQDPIRLAGGTNVAAYPRDPLTWVDPFGLAACGFDSDTLPKPIETPFGQAAQSTDPDAIAARSRVDSGATLYRIGTMGRSQAAEAQFWSLENPSSPGYADRYGLPQQNVANANFIETGTLKPGAPFVTRPAPPVGQNAGGGIEVVTNPGSVDMSYFGTK